MWQLTSYHFLVKLFPTVEILNTSFHTGSHRYNAICQPPAYPLHTKGILFQARITEYSLHSLGLKSLCTKSINIRLTEVIQVGDPPSKYTRMKEAIASEIPGLLYRGIFEVGIRAEIQLNVNVHTARITLTIRHKITQKMRLRPDMLYESILIGRKHLLYMARKLFNQ